MKNIFNFFARIHTSTLLSIFYLAGILSLGLSISLPTTTIETYRHILSALPFICWGIAGIVMIIRQEAYLLLRFEGALAVIIGIVVLLLNLFLVAIPFLVVIK